LAMVLQLKPMLRMVGLYMQEQSGLPESIDNV